MEVGWEELKQLQPKQGLLQIEAEGTVGVVSSRLSVKTVVFTKRLLKVLPMLLAGLFLLNTILSAFGKDYSIISYLASVGIIPWIFLMASSYLFRFCEYHRMFLWYILANNLLCWTDWEFGLPISNWWLFTVHIAIAGIFMFLVLYFHQRCRRKS